MGGPSENNANEKVVIVSHGVFGMNLTTLPEERESDEMHVGIHITNCEMLPVDNYLDL